jgi:hypothetical protein
MQIFSYAEIRLEVDATDFVELLIVKSDRIWIERAQEHGVVRQWGARRFQSLLQIVHGKVELAQEMELAEPLKNLPGQPLSDVKDRLDLPHRVVELIQGEEIAVHLFCSQPIAALRRVPARPREAR